MSLSSTSFHLAILAALLSPLALYSQMLYCVINASVIPLQALFEVLGCRLVVSCSSLLIPLKRFFGFAATVVTEGWLCSDAIAVVECWLL